MIRASLIVAVAIACATVSPATAATYISPGGETSTCLRATGAPGELTTLGKLKRASTPTDVLIADPSTVTRTGGTDLGNMPSCAEAESGGGVTAIAGYGYDTLDVASTTGSLRVAIRENSAAFSPPVTLATLSDEGEYGAPGFSVGVGGGGDTVVAWVETRGSVFRDEPVTSRIVTARRPRGGQFGPPQPLTGFAQEDGHGGIAGPIVKVDNAGTATILWARSLPSGQLFDGDGEWVMEAARVPKDGPAGPVERLSSRVNRLAGLALDVAPGGRAIAVWTVAAGVYAAERAPGAATFARAAEVVGTVDEPDASSEKGDIDVSVRDDGAAVLAWRTLADRATRVGLEATWRTAGGDFGAIKRVWSASTGNVIDEDDDGTTIYGPGGEGIVSYVPDGSRATAPYDYAPTLAALDDSGRITLTWLEESKVRVGDSLPRGWVASGTLDGASLQTRRLGSDCRATHAVVPLPASGGPLVAWADVVTQTVTEGSQYALGDGRVHVEEPQAAVPEPSRPRMTLSPPKDVQSIYYDQAALLPVRCDGPCDIRAWVPGPDGTVLAGTGLVLPRAGQGTLRLIGAEDTHLAPRRGGSVRVRTDVCDPATGRKVGSGSARLRLARRKPPPPARIYDAQADRDGNEVVVTWKTRAAAHRQLFTVTGLRTDEPEGSEDVVDDDYTDGSSRRKYRIRLQGRDIRYVVLVHYRRDVPRDEAEPMFLRVR